MKVHDLIQGTPQWQAYRAHHFNASDAPAMMGCSPYKTRGDLLRELHTGVAPEVDTATHMRFANGHRAEALARPLAERIVGEDLYPVTGSSGRLSASFDGLTLDGERSFEHKALNADLRMAMEDGDCGPSLPLHYRVQMEHQLLVSGARRVLFMASEWDAEGTLIEERHCWYSPDPALRRQIIDGWAQFERDLATYSAPPAAAPTPVGKAPETLPALRIEISGAVTASNLAEFKSTALAAIRSVNRELSTDQHFADAEKAVKWCAEVESRLAAAKEHALSQTASIDALFKAIDDISAEARRVRLDLNNLVTRRKTEVKEEAVRAARAALDQHVATLNAELAPMRLQPVTVDFAGAIKGLRSVASMQDALDTALAGGKIAADNAARGIRANVAVFKERAAGFEFLFVDLGQIVHKAADDFAAMVTTRVAAHQAAEEKRREAERARIQAEEEAKARAAVQRQAEDTRVADLASQREEAAAAESARIAAAVPSMTNAERIEKAREIADDIIAADILRVAIAQAPAPAPRRAEPATLKLGTICARLGITMTAAFVAETLGIAPKVEGASKLFTESQFDSICFALAAHVGKVQQQARVAALEAA